MLGMTAMGNATAPGGRERALNVLCELLDEAKTALHEWTPDVDIQTQLAARHSSRDAES
jgi:hypothetical protein